VELLLTCHVDVLYSCKVWISGPYHRASNSLWVQLLWVSLHAINLAQGASLLAMRRQKTAMENSFL
jgi:hypothetical protein